MSDLESEKVRIFEKYFSKEVKIGTKEYEKLPDSEKDKFLFFGGEYVHDTNLDITPEEMSDFLSLKSFEAQMETRNAIITIKNVIVFVFVVNIIAAILFFILMYKGI